MSDDRTAEEIGTEWERARRQRAAARQFHAEWAREWQLRAEQLRGELEGRAEQLRDDWRREVDRADELFAEWERQCDVVGQLSAMLESAASPMGRAG